MLRSARNLVCDVTGKLHSEAETAWGEVTPTTKVEVSSVATRLFALLFLVKGIECCATSKVQGENSLDEVMHPLPCSSIRKSRYAKCLLRPLLI